MIQKAEANKKEIGAENVDFQLGRVQDLTDIDASFDVIISNGAINLIPEKEDVLKAAFRLLKPGGWLLIADVFLVGTLSQDMKARIRSWFQ